MYIIAEEKRKHVWSVQVMNELISGNSSMYEHDDAGTTPHDHLADEGADPMLEAVAPPSDPTEKIEQEIPESTKSSNETAILVAARNGITEMVENILDKFPVAIHDMDEGKKTVAMIAVENRQLQVYKLFCGKKGFAEIVLWRVDADGNSVLHFAAKRRDDYSLWSIPGDALQMLWEIKWFRFVEASVPRRMAVRYNRKGETPEAIFTVTHKELVNGGGKWMCKTAESCSLVAALIATVAFATSTTIPGGVDDRNGTPIFEKKPGFHIFAISSLSALCLSVTSLVMFLSILTTRYAEKDFAKGLPCKLLLGFTSLFLAIAAMIVSFCSGHFFVVQDTMSNAALAMYSLTGIPVSFFAAVQFPLYFDLMQATFRNPFGKVKKWKGS